MNNKLVITLLIVASVILVAGCVNRAETRYDKYNIGVSPIVPWSKENINVDMDISSYIHPQASVIGSVHLGKNVMVAPQASVRGDEGMPIFIGDDSNVQDGVVIHALETSDEEGKPVEKNLVDINGKRYAVYIGNRVSLAHQAQVHGPASVGNDTFVGMQAFVFKSKVGNNVVLEPGTKVVGVTIPDGRYIPLGMIVNNQSIADNLPTITDNYVFKDLNKGVVNVNTNLARGYNALYGRVLPESKRKGEGQKE